MQFIQKNLMKKIFLAIFAIALLGGIYAFTFSNNEEIIAHNMPTIETTEIQQTTTVEEGEEGDLKWYTWEEAVAANEKEPRKIFVDVYTDWCGWCKVMDKKTFPIPEVKAYIEANFYPVKLDAEQKEDIIWRGVTFKWKKGGRSGYHELALSLSEGEMSFPNFVYLNEKFERIMISPGYKKPKAMMPELVFASEEKYLETTWKDFKKAYKKKK